MISKISFYILNNDPSLKGRDIYTCRIIEKAFNNNHKIYVYTASFEETQNFDIQLWTFSDISFIPHEIYNQESNLDTPVLIGNSNPPQELNNILINLTSNEAPFYKQFNHLIEVVPNDDHLKVLARKRFQIYQKAGFPIETFKIT